MALSVPIYMHNSINKMHTTLPAKSIKYNMLNVSHCFQYQENISSKFSEFVYNLEDIFTGY